MFIFHFIESLIFISFVITGKNSYVLIECEVEAIVDYLQNEYSVDSTAYLLDGYQRFHSLIFYSGG